MLLLSVVVESIYTSSANEPSGDATYQIICSMSMTQGDTQRGTDGLVAVAKYWAHIKCEIM